jgi:hypothetical protein
MNRFVYVTVYYLQRPIKFVQIRPFLNEKKVSPCVYPYSRKTIFNTLLGRSCALYFSSHLFFRKSIAHYCSLKQEKKVQK